MPHHPPHLFLDDTWYMITATTLNMLPYLRPNGYKDFVLAQLKILVNEFEMKRTAWVILDDHYHILIKTQTGVQLTDFFRRFHGRTSIEINSRDENRGRQVWHHYWDTCMRDESGFWTRFNYIHHNPVKHGYVKLMEDWPYSSFQYYLKQCSAEWLADAFRRYPIIDYTDAHD